MKDGIPFIQVTPKHKNEDKSIDVTFLMNHLRKKYIDKIIISGNTRTLEKVLERLNC